MFKKPCKCYDVNHNLTRNERRALHKQIKIARTVGDTATVRSIQHQLMPCPIKWGRKSFTLILAIP